MASNIHGTDLYLMAPQDLLRELPPGPVDVSAIDFGFSEDRGEMKYLAEFDWKHYEHSSNRSFCKEVLVLGSSSLRRLFAKIIGVLSSVEFLFKNLDVLQEFSEEIPGIKAVDHFDERTGFRRTFYKIFGELDQLKRFHNGKVGKRSVLSTLRLCPKVMKISGIWNSDFVIPSEPVYCTCSTPSSHLNDAEPALDDYRTNYRLIAFQDFQYQALGASVYFNYAEETLDGRFDIPLTKIFETSTRILSCARFRFRSSNLLSVSVDLRVIEEKAETWKASSLTFHGDDLGIPQIVNFNDCSCRIVMSLQTREILILEIDLLKKLTSPFYMSSEL
jgi:hypothetical protein